MAPLYKQNLILFKRKHRLNELLRRSISSPTQKSRNISVLLSRIIVVARQRQTTNNTLKISSYLKENAKIRQFFKYKIALLLKRVGTFLSEPPLWGWLPQRSPGPCSCLASGSAYHTNGPPFVLATVMGQGRRFASFFVSWLWETTLPRPPNSPHNSPHLRSKPFSTRFGYTTMPHHSKSQHSANDGFLAWHGLQVINLPPSGAPTTYGA